MRGHDSHRLRAEWRPVFQIIFVSSFSHFMLYFRCKYTNICRYPQEFHKKTARYQGRYRKTYLGRRITGTVLPVPLLNDRFPACKGTCFLEFSKYSTIHFTSIFLLLILYFVSTLPLLTIFHNKGSTFQNRGSLFQNKGTLLQNKRSHGGNIIFPGWECFIPKVGTILSLNGNFDSP